MLTQPVADLGTNDETTALHLFGVLRLPHLLKAEHLTQEFIHARTVATGTDIGLRKWA
ncbi:hypothetical protein SSPO_061010 [Streptomyces antimycoticus]|uniref:Uncharacterized protein n=1 Tax=Streptomyces antimycoticus TaxID=68175 RepID=A0A499UNF4_9ACTN|nr:hypothetical protein SSPO_061010 [Streptomyces antimycoticus]